MGGRLVQLTSPEPSLLFIFLSRIFQPSSPSERPTIPREILSFKDRLHTLDQQFFRSGHPLLHFSLQQLLLYVLFPGFISRILN